LSLFSQEKAETPQDVTQVENYREQIKRLMGFLEFSLNTLGDPETSTKEKEIIINESYIKAFLSDKVQIEDDLDENREILTYKDVQAYLKDVDFFFKKAEFNFEVQDIQSLTNSDGMTYFKVTANRNLKGETVEEELVSNNKTRYIEINLDDEEQVLKIASIYTTRLNEAAELITWWNSMPQEWKNILGYDYILRDSIRLSQVDILDDSTLLLVTIQPYIVEHESYVYIGTDSLLIMKQDTVLTELFDTIPSEKGAGLRALRNIIKMEELNVTGELLLTDLYPLDQLSELKNLDISNTPVTNLSPVRNLTRLVSLNISGTGIENLEPIRYNTRIMELYLDSTLVGSLEPINGFEALEVLQMSGSRVADILPVRGLANLKEIRMDNTMVSDLSPLADLAMLETASFSGTPVNSLEPLQYMAGLNRISFKNTAVSDLTALSRLDSLRIIDADQSQISDLSPLAGLPSLEKVYCDQTGITRSHANAFMADHPGVLVIYESQGLTDWWNGIGLDWQGIFRDLVTLDPKPTKEQLHRVTLLTKLDIRGNNNITSLDPLLVMSNLREVLASGTYISDLGPLAELTGLDRLAVAKTRISSLEPLASLTRLEEIDASDTPLDSLGGLENMKSLKTLTIDRTGVGNLDPLRGVSSIKVIYCDNTKVGKADIDRFLDIHPECLVIYQTTFLKSWWTGLPAAWQVVFSSHTQVDDPPSREQLHAVAGLTLLDLDEKREISSVEPLTVLSRLEDLQAANCGILEIAPLTSLVRLEALNLSGNPLTDLAPAGNMTGLRKLDISNTPVEKLDALKNLSKLEYLNCSGTQIKKLDPVTFLFGLKKLECQNTGINNLKPLVGLSSLRDLVCYNTKLNEKKVEAFKAEMPGVEVVYY
jgi:Leucine-rich repeat (LRR) protein